MVWPSADAEPTIRAFSAPEPYDRIERRSVRERVRPLPRDRLQIVWVNAGNPSPAGHRLARSSRILVKILAAPFDFAVRIAHPSDTGQRFSESLKSFDGGRLGVLRINEFHVVGGDAQMRNSPPPLSKRQGLNRTPKSLVGLYGTALITMSDSWPGKATLSG